MSPRERGAGIKLFCGDVDYPDGVIASRPMTEGEVLSCQKHKVTFQEFKIGQDGLVIFQNKGEEPLSLTLRDLTEALDEKTKKGNECLKIPIKLGKMWKRVFLIIPFMS